VSTPLRENSLPRGFYPTLSFDFDALYRSESRRVFATLVRLLGDFDLAEEATSEAFRAALEQWPTQGVPDNPRAWLVSAGRFKAIDGIRRQSRFEALSDEQAESLAAQPQAEKENIEDDRLRLIFTCCHPALAADAQVALTLREVCGLTTEEIARAFLTPAPTLAQRIVRAKTKIRDAKISYEVPGPKERVIYLVFNEGYYPSSGETLTRADLSQEAIRVGRLLVQLLPEPEAMGLLALMLIQESRRAARSTPAGDIVLLEDQDRTTWDRAMIAEGVELTTRALRTRMFGPYCLQAAIAAVHAEAPSAKETDWSEIIGLYDVLSRLDPSPIVALNRAVAVAMRDGPQAGLPLVENLLRDLSTYHLAHAVHADLHRRAGNKKEAVACYRKALSLVRQEPERRFLERRIAELSI
jgi:RNA polymerase sigma-70 factor, ECF subfamily